MATHTRRRLALLRLAAECPRCRQPVDERLPPREVLRYAGEDPDLPVRTVRCSARGCGRTFTITAGAYQRANAAA